MSRLARLACALLLLLAAPLRAEEEQLSNGLACAPDLSAAGVRDYNASLARAFACMERQIRALTKENAALAERAEAAEQAAEQALEAAAAAEGFSFDAPPLRLCTDNAAMIAWAGAERLARGELDGMDLSARPRWPLDRRGAGMLGSGRKGPKA